MTFWVSSCPSGNATRWRLDISAISAFALAKIANSVIFDGLLRHERSLSCTCYYCHRGLPNVAGASRPSQFSPDDLQLTCSPPPSWSFRRCRAIHGTLPGYAPLLFLLCLPSASLLDRQNGFWGRLAEPFGVKLFDKLRQGQLPRLLLVVIDLAQLRRVHPQFAGHLDLGVRQMVALSRLDPCLHLLSGLLRLLGHTIIIPSRQTSYIFRYIPHLTWSAGRGGQIRVEAGRLSLRSILCLLDSDLVDM